MSFTDWISVAGQFLSMTIGAVGTYTVTLGNAAGFLLLAAAGIGVVSLVLGTIFKRG